MSEEITQITSALRVGKEEGGVSKLLDLPEASGWIVSWHPSKLSDGTIWTAVYDDKEAAEEVERSLKNATPPMEPTTTKLFTESQLIAYAQQYAATNPELAELRRVAGLMLAALKDVTKRNELQNWFNVDKQTAAIAAAEAAEVK